MGKRGFTLIELVVVIAVISMVIAAVPLMLSAGSAGMSLKAAARTLAGGLREARSRAVVSNREVRFTVDARTGTVGPAADGRMVRLEGAPDIETVTVGEEILEDGRAAIRFYPDGGSSGGRITLQKNQQRYHVVVDWLTGRVSILD